MKNRVFNTTFENMLRVLVLMSVLAKPANSDRLTALDFICIYGKKCKVLDKNLHGANEFGFAEFANKREKITEAIKLSVKNDYVTVGKSDEGLVYSLNDRGKEIVAGIQSPYSKAYAIGAKIVCRKFANYTDEAVLKYISKLATESKEV